MPQVLWIMSILMSGAPEPVPSLGGALYFVSFTDEFSRKVWLYPLKNKSDVFVTFKQWKALIETKAHRRVRRFKSSNGSGYTSMEFQKFCKDKSIIHCHTRSGDPLFDEVAQNMNQTLMEKARFMRTSANLAAEFCAEALSTAAYLVNRSSSSEIKCKIPEEMWSGQLDDCSVLRIFGCTAYAHVKNDERKCIFLGYEDGLKRGYRLWDSESPRSVRFSSHVNFDESCVLCNKGQIENVDGKVKNP